MRISEEELERCLKDAHCEESLVDQVCLCSKKQQTQEMKRLLHLQRKQILDDIHKRQKDLDHIDFALWNITH